MAAVTVQVHYLGTLFDSLDKYGTGIVNFSVFESWYETQHASENSSGIVLSDQELDKVRHVWLGFEVAGAGVDKDAFYNFMAELRKVGLIKAAVARDSADADTIQKAHEEQLKKVLELGPEEREADERSQIRARAATQELQAAEKEWKCKVASDLAELYGKIEELHLEAIQMMSEADFVGAAVSCAQAMTLDKAGTYPAHGQLERLEQAAEHSRTAQELVRRGQSHLQSKDFKRAAKDFDGVLMLVTEHGELESMEKALKKDPELSRSTIIDHNALKLDPLFILILRDLALRKQQALELQRQGEVALEARDYSKAVELFLQALELDPDNAEIKQEEVLAEKRRRSLELMRQGDQQMAACQYEAALLTYKTALSLNPGDSELVERIESVEKKLRAVALKQQGINELAARDYVGAVGSFDQALALWPEHEVYQHVIYYEEIKTLREEADRKRRAQVLLRQAEQALSEGNPEQALIYLKEAAELDPDSNEIRVERDLADKRVRALQLMAKGLAQMKDDLNAEAVETFTAALSFDENNQTIYNLREEAARHEKARKLEAQADVQANADHISEAIEDYNAALELWPDNGEIQSKRDALLGEQARRIEAARQALIEKIKEVRLQAEEQMAMGDAASKYPDHSCDQAAEHYMECSMLCAQAEELDRERVYYEEGRRDIETLKAVAENKMRAQHMVRRAQEQMAATDFGKAVKTLDEALELEPGDEAITHLREEAALKARALELQYQGEVAMSKNNNERAVQLFLQALQCDPENAEIKEEEVLAEKRKRSLELMTQGDAQVQAGQLLLDGKVLSYEQEVVCSPERRASIRTRVLNAKTIGKKCDNSGRISQLVEQTIAQLKAADMNGVMRTLEGAHTAEFEAALSTYTTAAALNPGDTNLAQRVDTTSKRVKALEFKRAGIHELDARDYPAAVDSLKKGLAQWEDNGEIKYLLKLGTDKVQAHVYKKQAEEYMEQNDADAADEYFLRALELDPTNEEIKEEEVAAHKSHSTNNLKAQGDAHTAAGLALLDAKLSTFDLHKDANDVHARDDIGALLTKAATKMTESDMQVAMHQPTEMKPLPGGRSMDGSVAMWLQKKSPSVFKGWQNRWFVFQTSGEIAYYNDEKELQKKKSSVFLQDCIWVTSNHLEHGHFELHFSNGKCVELRVLDKSRETLHTVDSFLKLYFLAGKLAPGNDGMIHEETLADKQARIGTTMHLINRAEQSFSNDPSGTLPVLEEAHTAEFEAALAAYKTALSLNPGDKILLRCVDGAQKKVDALAQKRQGIHEVESRDYSSAVGTFDRALEMWPENMEVKRLREEADRKRRAYDLLHQAEEAISRGDPVEAIRLLKEALTLDPNNRLMIETEQVAENKLQAQKLKARGLQQMEAEEFSPAAASFNAACALDADDKELPVLHQTATDKARARELAVLALAEFEHSPGLRADRAFSLFDEALGLWDCAEIRASRDSCEAELNRRLAELITRITGLHTKASKQYEDKNYADCIATCEQALVLDQDTVYSQRADLEALLAIAQRKQRAQQLLRQSREQMLARDYNGAVASLEEAFHLDPESEIIRAEYDEAVRKARIQELTRQAEAALANNENAKAVELFLQALALDPDNAKLKEEEVIAEKHKQAEEIKRVGDEQMASGLYEKARASYQAALGLNSSDAELPLRIDEATLKKTAKELQKQGDEAYAVRDYAGSVAAYDQALTQWAVQGWADNAEIQRSRDRAARKLQAAQLLAQARTELSQDNPEEAVKLLQKAMSLDPDNAVLKEVDIIAERQVKVHQLRRCALDHMKLLEFQAAVDEWVELLTLIDATDVAAAGADQVLRDEAKAKAKAKALGVEAELELEHDHVEQAIATFNEALKLAPQSEKATDDNKLYIWLLQNRDAAINRREDALAAQVADYLAKARQYQKAGDDDNALLYLKQAMAADPENARVLELEQLIAQQIKQRAEVKSLTERGEKAMAEGDNAKALKYFNKALAVFNSDDKTPYHAEHGLLDHDVSLVNEVLTQQKQGEALYACQRFDESVDAFERALAVEPNNAEIKEWLAKAKVAAEKWAKANALVEEGSKKFAQQQERVTCDDIPGAKAKFMAALEVWPEHPAALEWLARCKADEEEVAALQAARRAEEERLKAEEEAKAARRRAQEAEEARRRAEEERQRLEEEHRKALEAEAKARRQAEEEAKRAAEKAAQQARLEAQHQAEEEARRVAEAGAAAEGARLEAIDRHNESEANKALMKAAAAKAAANVFEDLKLPTDTSDDSPQKLNFMRFMRWWQKKLKTPGSGKKGIEDAELQICQKIWHVYDDDGCGVSPSQLGSILENMLKEGAISIAANGQVVVSQGLRDRKLTGL